MLLVVLSGVCSSEYLSVLPLLAQQRKPPPLHTHSVLSGFFLRLYAYCALYWPCGGGARMLLMLLHKADIGWLGPVARIPVPGLVCYLLYIPALGVQREKAVIIPSL